MKPYILVALDGSRQAETILSSAVTLARATGSRLSLLRVITPARSLLAISNPALVAPIDFAEWEADEIAQARLYLSACARRLNERGLTVQTEIMALADVASAIVARAQGDPEIGMIAMATHQRTGVARWIIGSVAEQVLHCARKPVLLVPAADDRPALGPPVTYRTIIVPLDGSAFAEQAIETARTIAAATGATLVLTSAIPVMDDIALAESGIEPMWMLAECEATVQRVTESLEHIAARLRAEGLSVRTKPLMGDAAEAIIELSAAERADLLIMATHGRGGLQRLMLGSVASGVVRHTRVPILLIRPEQREPQRERYRIEETQPATV